MIKFGSVCSGVEAASVAWEPLGFKAAWYSEIEPFCSEVLRQRFTDVPNLGDMTKIHKEEYFNDNPIDLLVGGTPCQSFSVAGLRQGLADPRGNLALVYLSLVERKRPRWIVWENVPGVLSSNGGRDFGAFLGALGKLGYGFSYRVLDAQYFGVAQRRRRVFVVGHLGDWRAAAEVLFEPHSLQGYSPPRRQAREGAADGAGGQPAGGSGTCVIDRAAFNQGENAQYDALVEESETMPTLVARGPHAVAHTLRARGWDASEDGTGRGIPLVPAVAWALQHRDAKGPDSDTKDGHLIPTGQAVRRLTPRECERLQGFPDDWTLITYRGKPSADSHRYKAMGNSMAVPVMRWIGSRIQMVNERIENGAA